MNLFLVGWLLIFAALAAGESEESDIQSTEKIESALAVVGRVFVYFLPVEGGHASIFKVSDEL